MGSKSKDWLEHCWGHPGDEDLPLLLSVLPKGIKLVFKFPFVIAL
jgi:hypothetical protein